MCQCHGTKEFLGFSKFRNVLIQSLLDMPFSAPAAFAATVMDPDYTQQQVYESTAADVVSSLLNGMNGCLLCYGQTGSGKTYTTFGPEGALPQAAQVCNCLQADRNIRDSSSAVLQ